jgi:hypothetical protein
VSETSAAAEGFENHLDQRSPNDVGCKKGAEAMTATWPRLLTFQHPSSVREEGIKALSFPRSFESSNSAQSLTPRAQTTSTPSNKQSNTNRKHAVHRHLSLCPGHRCRLPARRSRRDLRRRRQREVRRRSDQNLSSDRMLREGSIQYVMPNADFVTRASTD